MFVFKELARKAQEDWLDDDAIKQELQEIYALVEAGKISTQDFEARECRLLERLEQIAKAKFHDKWGAAEANAPALIEGSVVEPRPEIRLELDTTPLTGPAPAIDLAPIAPPPLVVHAPPIVEPARPPLVLPPVAPLHAAAPLPPLSPPAPAAPPVTPARGLSIGQVLESTSRALAMLNLKVTAITSVAPGDDGWRVTAELLERKGVPDTNDLIGVYELRLDTAGNVTRYERTRLRRRGDLGR